MALDWCSVLVNALRDVFLLFIFPTWVFTIFSLPLSCRYGAERISGSRKAGKMSHKHRTLPKQKGKIGKGAIKESC